VGSSSDRTALAVLAARSVPVTTAAARLVGVAAPLADLLPEGGLRRGSTVGVGGGRSGRSGVSLALALLSSASAAGAWCAAVALPDLGLVAAAELGVALERLALVPHPGDQWPMVVAALLESIDVVVVRPPERTRVADARRLAARARERGAVLVTLDGTGSRVWGWPEAVDVRLEVIGSTWSGLGRGYGYLQDRELEVTVTGRRGATRARTGRLYLPGGGGVHPAPGPVPAKGTVGRPAPAPAAQAG
jgi:hypothetical protein